MYLNHELIKDGTEVVTTAERLEAIEFLAERYSCQLGAGNGGSMSA